MHSKPNLVSLCGIADDATEADLSGLGMDADGAAILASELPDKGALKKIDARDNNIDRDGKQALQQAAGSRCVWPCQDVCNHKALVLTPSALPGPNACSNPPAWPWI
jgi:hypothetical protein